MKKNIILIVFSLFLLFVTYGYWVIYKSSISLEKNKIIYNKITEYSNRDLLDSPVMAKVNFNQSFNKDPSLIESYLRYRLLGKKYLTENQLKEMRLLYGDLLKKRPTWPYYYSGLSQVGNESDKINTHAILMAIKTGPHETKVVKNIAEILFSQWSDFDKKNRQKILSYLSKQSYHVEGNIIEISSKFAKLYIFCDYLYEKNHKTNSLCERNYWQPLLAN